MCDMKQALVIFLPGQNQDGAEWKALQEKAGAALPWVNWSFPTEASSLLRLVPPLRFIRVEGSACCEPTGLSSAISAVHAMLRQAEATGYQSERVVVSGFGPGGAIALAAARAYPKRLAGVAVFSGWVAGMCTASEANRNTPVLMCHGSADTTVSHHLLNESVNFLRGHHAATVTANSIPGLGHSQSPAQAALLRQFLCAVFPEASGADEAEASAAPPPAAPALSKSVIKMGGRAETPAVATGVSTVGDEASAGETSTGEVGTRTGTGVKMWKQMAEDDPTEEEMVVAVDLPGVESMAALTLEICPGQLSLEVPGRDSPVLVEIEEHWDTETAKAKFNKKRQTLTVRLARRAK